MPALEFRFFLGVADFKYELGGLRPASLTGEGALGIRAASRREAVPEG